MPPAHKELSGKRQVWIANSHLLNSNDVNNPFQWMNRGVSGKLSAKEINSVLQGPASESMKKKQEQVMAEMREMALLVCCFVLLTRYWGIVTVPGFPCVNRPQTTWGGRILALHLNYVAAYTRPLLFLFERTHNYPSDNQGLLPWRLRCLGESKIRSASLVRVLSGGKISWVQWSQDLRNPPPPTTKQSNTFWFF